MAETIKVGEWEVDAKSITCTCPHFRFRLKAIAKHDPRRLCKHLKSVESQLTIPKPRVSKSAKTRHLREVAEHVVNKVESLLKSVPNVEKWEFCGSYRRKKDTVGDLDLLVWVNPSGKSIEISDTKPMYELIESVSERKIEEGPSKARFVIDGIQMDVRNVEKDHWPFALMHFTGSMQENVRLRAKAKRMGMALNEYTLRDREGYKMKASSEEEIYALLGETYRTPESR